MKRFLLISLAILAIVILGAISYIKLALPNVGDAPQITINPTPELIARGAYLANSVCVCMDCHSTRDWSKFAGPPIPGTTGKGGEKFPEEFGFPGVFYSRNITPANLGSWTDGEIFRTITTGVDKDGKALFPVMPYHNYGLMDEEDIKAIIAYIRTIPAIENETPPSEPNFPMSILINTIPAPAQLSKRPDQSDAVAYGKYLTNAAACAECHTRSEQGKKVEGMDFAGGMEFKMPFGIVRSGNLTSDASGIGGWTREAFVNRFKQYADSTWVPYEVGTGFQTVMPWNMYATMTPDDLGAIYDYLMSVKPISNKVEKYTAVN